MSKHRIQDFARWAALRITLLYCGMAVVWIIASDRFLALIIEHPEQLTQLQTYKGLLFVLITTGLIYVERLRAETEIRILNQNLEQRVAERTASLQAMNEQLQALDILKSKFVSDVSHELRTPIQNQKMYMELLRRGVPEKQADYWEILSEQTDRLQRLVENILDFSRLEREKQHVKVAPVDLNGLVDQVIAAQQPHAEVCGLLLIFQPAPELPEVPGSVEQLTQVIVNLVANAINYTPEGHVQVSTYQIEDSVCLEVEDTGVGIAPEDRLHLFERFYRGETAKQTNVPGTGLGLSIVKEIVDLHGGTIEIESEVGRGTTVLVCFPATPKAGV